MKPGMPESAGKPSGTVLAFDFGEKRIGVAVGEWQLRQAHPLTTLHGEANAERFTAIAALIEEWQPASLVVGRPLSLDGTAHAMTARCTRFANQLRGRFGSTSSMPTSGSRRSKPRSACGPREPPGATRASTSTPSRRS
jgi:hypothetical protein